MHPAPMGTKDQKILHFIEFCLDFCCKTDSAKNTDNSTKSNMNTITTDKKEGK